MPHLRRAVFVVACCGTIRPRRGGQAPIPIVRLERSVADRDEFGLNRHQPNVWDRLHEIGQDPARANISKNQPFFRKIIIKRSRLIREYSISVPKEPPEAANGRIGVEPCRLSAERRTAGTGAQPGVQGGRGELPRRVASRPFPICAACNASIAVTISRGGAPKTVNGNSAAAAAWSTLPAGRISDAVRSYDLLCQLHFDTGVIVPNRPSVSPLGPAVK